MDISGGFFLGLSTGAICVAYCGPVMLPYLMGEGSSVKRNVLLLALFLTGRLLAYVLVGTAAGLLGKVFLQPSALRNIILGTIYLLLSGMLIAYGFHRFKEICLGKAQQSIKDKISKRFVYLVPFIAGIVTGLNLCPPFLLAITEAMETGKVADSIFFFMMFFLGTVVYFIPFPFIGFFHRQHVLRIIGKFAAIFTGLIYFYQGLVLLLK